MTTLACSQCSDRDATGLVVSSSLASVAEIAAAVHRGVPAPGLLELVAAKIAQTTGHSMALMMEPDPTSGAFAVVASSGVSEEYVDAVSRQPVMTSSGDRGEAPTSRAFRSRRPVAASAPQIVMPQEWERRADLEGIRSMLSLPLLTGNDVGYVVNVYCGVAGCFGDRAILAAENLTNLIGLLLDIHRTAYEHRNEARNQRHVINVLEAKTRAMRQVQGNIDALHRLVVDGAGVERIVAELAALSAATLEVADGYGRVLASAGQDHDLRAEPDGSRIVVDREIVISGEVVGTLRIGCDAGAASRTETAGILHAAPTLIALVLQQQWVAMEAEARLRGDLVEELLSSPGISESALVAHARARWGIDLTASAWIVVARVTKADGPDAQRPGRPLLGAAERLVRRTPRALLVAEHDHHLVALCQDSPEEEAREFADALRRELTAYAGQASVAVAVGGRNDSVAGHRDAYRQAVALLDLVTAADGPGRTVAADDFGLARLLLGVKDPRDLLAFAERTLGPLRAYDERRRAGLVETLGTYLDTGCNVQDTARALHLHSNSVGYRLKRISDLLGLANLSEPRVLLHLELALSVSRLTGISAPSPANEATEPGGAETGQLKDGGAFASAVTSLIEAPIVSGEAGAAGRRTPCPRHPRRSPYAV